MRTRPWYKRFPANFIAGTVGLSLEEKGAYSLVLDLIYDRGGAVPDDGRAIAGVCGCSLRKWSAIRERLLSLGKLAVVDGKLTNERAEQELLSSEKEADKFAENGSKGGRKRAENARETAENKDLEEKGLKHARVPEARGKNYPYSPPQGREAKSRGRVWKRSRPALCRLSSEHMGEALGETEQQSPPSLQSLFQADPNRA